MGKEPINENTNVYFQARKKAAIYNERLFSRESAAELLGISSSTLAGYELDRTKVVPVDKVVLMAEMCNISWKRREYQRFRPISDIARYKTGTEWRQRHLPVYVGSAWFYDKKRH